MLRLERIKAGVQGIREEALRSLQKIAGLQGITESATRREKKD